MNKKTLSTFDMAMQDEEFSAQFEKEHAKFSATEYHQYLMKSLQNPTEAKGPQVTVRVTRGHLEIKFLESQVSVNMQ